MFKIRFLLLIIIIIKSNYACDDNNNVGAKIYISNSLTNRQLRGCRIFNEHDVSEVQFTTCLDSVKENTFQEMRELTKISMVELCIKQVSANFFRNTPKLSTIILRSNQIQLIESNVFQRTPLETLDLSYNWIKEIGKCGFCNMKLALLDLQHNRLHQIDETWFENSSVEKLNLANNKIIKLSSKTFQNIKSIKELNLMYNNIDTIEDGIQINSLKTLMLNGNWLSDLKFLKRLQVSTLDVSFNKISYIRDEELSSIKNIVIQPNPWQCACLRRLWKYIKNTQIIVNESPSLIEQWQDENRVCFAPRQQGFMCTYTKDKRFFEVHKEYFKFFDYAAIGQYT